MPSPTARHRRPARLAVLVVGLFVLAQSGSGRQPGAALAPAAPPLPIPGLVPGQPEPAKNGEAAVPEYTLGECIAIALERQPTLRAVRSSQAASGAGIQALDNIGRLGQLVAKDLPVRKEQAQRGATAVAADVQKTHNEIVHDVTRLYYTAVYARQVGLIAEDVVAQVELMTKIGKQLLDAGAPKMTKAKLNVMEIGLE
ncbi:MAG TPA: hypothetical protein VD866_08200, partial [Urbifossiella sp.]|nr:hypothetical protein [Urbifossiella sp.]